MILISYRVEISPNWCYIVKETILPYMRNRKTFEPVTGDFSSQMTSDVIGFPSLNAIKIYMKDFSLNFSQHFKT